VLVVLVAGCASTRDVGRKRGCQTYLIVPPQSSSQAASEEVAATWIEAVLPHLDKCDKIIKDDAAREVFRFANVSHSKPLPMKDPRNAQLDVLRSKTNATHVVFLAYKVQRRTLTVRAQIYRLKPKWVEETKKGLDEEVFAKYQRTLPKNSPLVTGDDFKSLFAGLIPNTVTLGAATSEMTNDRVDNGEVEQLEAHRRNALPYIVQGLGVANVAHRSGYRLFDADWGLSGALRFLADSPSLVLRYKDPARRSTPDETTTYAFAFYSLAALVTIDGFLYTPLGTSYFGVGLGFGPYRFQDSDGVNVTAVQSLGRMHLGHRVFLSDRWYLELSAESITFMRGIVDGPYFKAYTMDQQWFGIGWFFPRRGWLD
jgi:hypothetical protein